MQGLCEGRIQTLAEIIINEIKQNFSQGLVVAFSGGEDSSLVAYLAKEALGPDRVILATVDFGPATYTKIREQAKLNAQKLGLKHIIIDGTKKQRKILRYGPNCNACTREAKLGSVLEAFPSSVVATGANKSDSWGLTGLKFFGRLYSPLFDLRKDEIRKMVKLFQIPVAKAGESSFREGCKMKHLLKMLINPNFHGRAVWESNEILLSFLDEIGYKAELANVKIIGPLSKNIALVNVQPFLPLEYEQKLIERLKINCIDEIHVVKQPIKLRILANPGIYNDEKARQDIFMGFIQRDFAVPLKAEWIKSTNNRLRTFQVVGYEIDAG
ncbi:adenine nucleotide alpha-hydrolase family protein [Pseudothermotoga thermarum]|uniref:ExsB family protein n=1 Tax=Pseudothermotoga thermarum DSM 5069 TaxID=688269 RepID=F7YX35_9THEM|nr:ExsB family protein [Pseudothermotoga thermarum]AEH50796.1 ExsB family protein [Pseudothermotoga thermarum DSM 5069]